MKTLQFKCIKKVNLWTEMYNKRRWNEGWMWNASDDYWAYANREKIIIWIPMRPYKPSEYFEIAGMSNIFTGVFLFYTVTMKVHRVDACTAFSCNAKAHVVLINVKITILCLIKATSTHTHTHVLQENREKERNLKRKRFAGFRCIKQT